MDRGRRYFTPKLKEEIYSYIQETPEKAFINRN